MEEPSVLDYVKAKLAFWKKSDLRVPMPDEGTTVDMDVDTFTDLITRPDVPPDVPPRERLAGYFINFPWLMSCALFLALAAQLVIEPPGRNWQLALVLYLSSALCLGFVYWRGGLRLADSLPGSEPGLRPADRLVNAWVVSAAGLTLAFVMTFSGLHTGDQSVLQVGLRAVMIGLSLLVGLGATAWGLLAIVGISPGQYGQKIASNSSLVLFVVILMLLIVAAFISFKDAHFTRTNLVLWLLSLVFAVIAVAKLDPRSWWAAGKARFSRPFTIRIDLFVLLLLVVIALTAYFRFYNLDGLPGEMFSDHAEKLYDVNDVLHGEFNTFFIRNTGRELFQFYWTAFVALLFNTGISFMSLKIGTVIAGLVTLYFIYRLGEELGGKWVGLYALFFAAIAYWPNIISRIGLRFPLYPFCVAPVLFYLLRGLRREERNDFIWAGLWLGIGLHGYTASRIVPLLVLVAFGLYGLHKQLRHRRGEALVWLGILAFITFVVSLPLFRYALDNPADFSYRTLTRISTLEQPLPGSVVSIFFSNLWNALTMFFWNNGDVWVHSIPGRPALAVVDAALFFIGAVLLAARYLKRFHWRDLFLLVSIPILLLPSVLSLAFPNENPNLNRTAGAYVVVFVILGLGLDALLRTFREQIGGRRGWIAAAALGLGLALLSLNANYTLFFNRYAREYNTSAWNTSELGAVMRGFSQVVGTPNTSWVVGYPHWVDTRLVGINAGYPERNPETGPADIEMTFEDPLPKLYLLNVADVSTLNLLQERFPAASFWLHRSPVEGKDFIVFMVPAAADALP